MLAPETRGMKSAFWNNMDEGHDWLREETKKHKVPPLIVTRLISGGRLGRLKSGIEKTAQSSSRPTFESNLFWGGGKCPLIG